MGLYTIRYGYRNNSFFIASNTAGQFIVIDALGAKYWIKQPPIPAPTIPVILVRAIPL
ncbi:hypothetical protein ITE68_18580, partial [Acinetobacter baumannii]|nr:hypothetical protein [Acinetobacter baumannii]